MWQTVGQTDERPAYIYYIADARKNEKKTKNKIANATEIIAHFTVKDDLSWAEDNGMTWMDDWEAVHCTLL